MTHSSTSCCDDHGACESGTTTAKALTERAESKMLDAKAQMELWVEQAEISVKEQPVKALAVAAAAGYLLNQLPLRSIVSANVKVATSILPPALFLYGAAKLYQFAKSQRAGSASEH